MNPRTLLLSIATLLASMVTLNATAQTASAVVKAAKLVIQVSDGEPAKWNLALNNAKNVQDELGAGKVDIEVVAYGPGLNMLKLDAATNSRVSSLSEAGIQFVACENTMRNMKLGKDDIHPAAAFANSGVVAIMTRQSQGWAYVRP
jgi:uncharacterized protein